LDCPIQTVNNSFIIKTQHEKARSVKPPSKTTIAGNTAMENPSVMHADDIRISYSDFPKCNITKRLHVTYRIIPLTNQQTNKPRQRNNPLSTC